MEKILVSKCLLGAKVRYFGGDALCMVQLVIASVSEAIQ